MSDQKLKEKISTDSDQNIECTSQDTPPSYEDIAGNVYESKEETDLVDVENTHNFPPSPPKKNVRNLLGFWLLGLCNNYAYVIMLSAAFDLNKMHKNNTTHNETICNPISTGAILLADILPSLLIKIIAPFIILSIHYRVLFAIVLSSLSFIITSFSVGPWMTFIGVVCAALSSGFGEVSFLSFSSFFDKDVVSTWSSGTGGAGVLGALSYASLTHILTPREALLVMLIVPIVMGITFWVIIDHPPALKPNCRNICSTEMEPMLRENVDLSSLQTTNLKKSYTFQQKIALIKPLLKYMIPLGLVYFAEYFINQGLMELLYFPNVQDWLSHDDQYRWYQVDYQVGVLISRSSVNIFQIQKLWILPILQFLNLILLLVEVCSPFMKSIWIVLLIIFYEGLLGGSAYVNTFYKISTEVPAEDREFSMGIASLGDSVGIAIAGLASVPAHDALCRIVDRSF